jgi:predicted nucleotidyltransferase
MDAKPALVEVGRALLDADLEAVLIGNAAAALQGAPVTTVDFDFLFRSTPRNLAKLKDVAKRLGAAVLRPYYPASGLFRVVRDDDGLQVDFMTSIHGVRSFEGLRDRASRMDIEGTPVLVASLDDVIRSKKAARRPRDLAVIEVLERAREAKARQAGVKTTSRRARPRK